MNKNLVQKTVVSGIVILLIGSTGVLSILSAFTGSAIDINTLDQISKRWIQIVAL